VTKTRLAVYAQHAQGACEIKIQDACFVARRRRTEHAGRQPTIDRRALFILFDKIGVAIIFDQTGDAIKRILPADILLFARTRSPILWALQTLFAMDEIQQSSPFGAQ
jgi:hypothetical protein